MYRMILRAVASTTAETLPRSFLDVFRLGAMLFIVEKPNDSNLSYRLIDRTIKVGPWLDANGSTRRRRRNMNTSAATSTLSPPTPTLI